MNKKIYVRSILCALFLTLMFHGFKVSADECLNDMLTRVKGKENCLAIHTYIAQSEIKPSSLVIFIHGDQSDGGPVSSMIKLAQDIDVPAGVVKIALLRPGYFDKAGNTSTGTNFRRRDSYTPANLDEVTSVIQSLQRYYGSGHTVIVGHSGGAAYAGVMIGRTPGIANSALLLSCPCDIHRWRTSNQSTPWSSLSPISFAETVPTNMRVIAITGEYDINTREFLAEAYIDALAKGGVSAQFRRAVGAGHNETVSVEVVAQPLRALLSSN